MKTSPENKLPSDEEVIKKASSVRKRTWISFLVFLLFFVAVIAGWKWLNRQPREGGQLKPLRKSLRLNDNAASAIFSSQKKVKEYPVSKAVKPRLNGNVGMSKNFDTSKWVMKVLPFYDRKDTLKITLNDIKKLPKTEIVYDFKCIEGWDQVTHWGGVRFSDFVKAYHLIKAEYPPKYISLVTPDGKYYVGIDFPSMMQPQTILCYEMDGKPLPINQGAPLRLIIPVKYGIKSLKRIGTMGFSSTPPKDYWAERGYDYFAGL